MGEALTHLTDAGMYASGQWECGMVTAEWIEFPVVFQTPHEDWQKQDLF